MTNTGVGDNHNLSDRGDGFSGVTPAEKDWAAGRMYVDEKGQQIDPVVAVRLNTEYVAAKQGSGHWSSRGGDGSNGGQFGGEGSSGG